MLTREYVRNLFNYDLLTGKLTWKVFRKGTKGLGSEAGSKKEEGYRQVNIDGRLFYTHQIAFLYMLGSIPEQVDHDNHIRDDNRWVNLFPSSNKKNGRNQSLRVDNKSGVTGVSWDSKKKAWRSRIKVDGVDKHLGYWSDKDVAIRVRKDAELLFNFNKNHGSRQEYL